MSIKRKHLLSLFFLPSLLGVVSFFVIPFFLALYNAFKDNFDAPSYGLSNYINTIRNPLFHLGTKNFLIFASISIISTSAISLVLALLLNKKKYCRNIFLISSLLPFFMPSGCTSFFWNCIFELNGLVNRFLYQNNFEIIIWGSSGWSILIPIFIYIWKFTGFFTLFFSLGLNSIPKEYYEIAQLEGVTKRIILKKITLVFLAPFILMAFFLSFVFTFRISKELFILFGKYPNENLYFVQHFISNQLNSMNLPTLSASSCMIVFVFLLILIPIWRLWTNSLDVFSNIGEFNSDSKREPCQKRIFLYVCVLSFFFLLPIVFTFSNSFMEPAEFVSRYSSKVIDNNLADLSREGLHFVNPTLLPTKITGSQYIDFFLDIRYLRMFWNSVLCAFPVLILHILVSIFASYALYRAKRNIKTVLFIYTFFMIIPSQVMITPQYIFFQSFHVSTSYWEIALPAIFNTMGTCIIYFYLQGFPKECIEAAQVDGAEEFSIFLRIVLPNMRGIIAILTIYTFSESWNLIDQAVVFIKNNYQLPLSMYLSDILQENMGVISSGSIVYMIPPTLLFIICLLWFKINTEK